MSAYRNDLNTATAERESKAYATLAAQYALHGVELVKSDPEKCRQAPDFAASNGLWKPLVCLDAARAYLEEITGARYVQKELQAQ